MSHLGILLLIAGALAVITFAPDARACWDGRAASSPRVSIAVPGDDTFDPADARAAGVWLQRIEAILPPSASVTAFGETLSICAKRDQCKDVEWQPGRYDRLFDQVAAGVGAESSVVSRARHMAASVFTVQVLASRSRKSAEAFAARIDAPMDLDPGFYDAGGFPAVNPVARVVASSDTGRPIWRVIVGTYLDRQQADSMRINLARRGVHGFVREL